MPALRTIFQEMYEDETFHAEKLNDYGYSGSLYPSTKEGLFELIVEYFDDDKHTQLCLQIMPCKDINTIFITDLFGYNYRGYDDREFYDFSNHGDIMELLANDLIMEFTDILGIDEFPFITPYTTESFSRYTYWFRSQLWDSALILDLPLDVTENIYNINKPSWLSLGESDLSQYNTNLRSYVF